MMAVTGNLKVKLPQSAACSRGCPGCLAHRCGAVAPNRVCWRQRRRGTRAVCMASADSEGRLLPSSGNNLLQLAAAQQGSGAGVGSPQVSQPVNQGEHSVQSYLSGRVHQVSKHFPNSLSIDDFVARVEMALYAFGFNGDNTIACSNLCRDEVTIPLKHKLDAVFGSSFNINGLGGVLTCGVTGLKAGLSHAPAASNGGKERYVFFSFPHIGIDATGSVGNIARPGQPGTSAACGALKAALGQFQGEGLAANCTCAGVHEPRDPEYSILKQRLARRLRYEGLSEDAVQQMNLVDMTKVAERTITDDLEYLIQQGVDTSKADYAVVTGVQIHNTGEVYDDESPNLEFVAPCSMYVVIGGERTYLDITSIPSMTPRQISMLAAAGSGGKQEVSPAGEGEICGSAGNMTTVRALDTPHMYDSAKHQRAVRKQAENYRRLLDQGELEVQTASVWPAWQRNMQAQAPYKAVEDNSTLLDQADVERQLAAVNGQSAGYTPPKEKAEEAGKRKKRFIF